MRNLRNSVVAAVALTAVIALGGCSTAGSGDTARPAPDSSAESTFNDADVTFARMMVPHHEQAVEMSDIVIAKEGIDERITDLASQVKDAQEPEIQQLNDWLDAWGAEHSMGGMEHGSDGMMSDDDMRDLEDASGNEAAVLFLEQMIMHHEGAIEMAQTEIDEGENADAIEMAETIVSTQSEEISAMEDLLHVL